MTGWLSLALGLIQLANYVFGKLDEAQKFKVWEEMQKTELGRITREEIAKAHAARATVDPDLLRAPDPESRT